MGFKLIDIGNQIKLDTTADKYNRVNEHFRDKMNKIDIIPVNPSISVFVGNQDFKGLVGYEFDARIERYRELCEQYIHEYDIEVAGLRLWTTAETSIQEGIYNIFDQNTIEQMINGFSSQSAAVRNFLNSFQGGATSDISELLSSAINEGGPELFNNFTNPDLSATLSSGLADTAAWISSGAHISLPKIWKASSYVPSMSVKIKLVSPYGSPESIRKHVLDPLLYLLILCSPESSDGLTYANVSYLKIKAYGLANFNLGYIENVSINRGGESDTFNKYMQPLSIDLTLTIKAAFDGFAVVNKGPNSDGVKSNVIENDDYINLDNNQFEKLDGRYGLTSIDNIIDSFRKYQPNERKFKETTSSRLRRERVNLEGEAEELYEELVDKLF